MKIFEEIWEWIYGLIVMLPLFLVGWLLGEIYLNLRAGFVWARMRANMK